MAAPLLAKLLEDLSPKVNALALQALKLWATKECLPQLEEFARRQEKAAANPEAAANNSVLIDVLAQFPDRTAAEAIALQLKDGARRGKAVQALLKLSPVAAEAVLPYVNHPDGAVQKEARSLCRLLNVPADRQLEQTLADVADTRKPRRHVALLYLAKLRPDDANRAKVSQALNAPLLDPDPRVRADALNAVQVWGSKENTTTLVKALGDVPSGDRERDARLLAEVGKALIATGPQAEEAVIPLLKSPEGVVRSAAYWVLSEIGTDKSVQPLQEAAWLDGSVSFNPAQQAIDKIMARE